MKYLYNISSHIFTIILIFFSTLIDTKCTKENLCLACNSTTIDKCDACFNWRTGTITARALNPLSTPSNCKTLLNLTVAYCKFYVGTTLTTDTEKNLNTCQICDKEYLIWNDT